ncbi:4Fe-4S dicluster domain-containing protein [uncultured Bacteroides sp.]|uniref:ATP-binding protein n=1 Tax=uncultured Bacteroides sp. TaxID=162156 RepID=UPI002AA5F7A5|nr:4Fe-4S dicluster domain-containing protein [uncultured Bacteroides sp.]
MKRTIIKIDEKLCNGCGLCVKGCHEGALQVINGKATMVSELYCDGLGACIGDCPEGAITLEEREAEAYDETAVTERLMPTYADQTKIVSQASVSHHGCPGSREMTYTLPVDEHKSDASQRGELQQWPVQLHLVSPVAAFLKGADLLVAADCCAFTVGDFHQTYLKGKRLVIACPKLDQGKDVYIRKLSEMIDHGGVNTLTVMIMEVPCCGGLLYLCEEARKAASRNVPLKLIRISLKGEQLEEKWM